MMGFFKFVLRCFFYIGYNVVGSIAVTPEDKLYGTHAAIGSLLFSIPLLIWLFKNFWANKDIYSVKSPLIPFLMSLALMLIYLGVAYVFFGGQGDGSVVP